MKNTLLIALLLPLAGSLHAQQAQVPNSESLLINAGDRLQIRVFEVPELDEKARVTDAGDLPLVLGGTVHVAGLTPAEAARAIESVLVRGEFLLHPQVSVIVDEYQAGSASVVGQVKTPGTYPIATPRNILSVVALAGGLSENADRHLVVIRHGSGEKVPFYFSNNLTELEGNSLMVNPGDTIVVSRGPMFFVLGDVNRAGGYVNTTNHPRVSVLEAVALAGGTSPTAAVDHAVLVRKDGNGQPVEMALRIGDMRRGKTPSPLLEPDDILYIPFSYLRNIAVGAGGLISAAASAGIYRF